MRTLRMPGVFVLLAAAVSVTAQAPQRPTRPSPSSRDPQADRLRAAKQDVAARVDGMRVQTQQMIDQVFSFGELGYQEVETSKYLTGVLERNGFTIERGVAGMPTGWVATWGSGKPVIALGSDIDDIPQASQKPGVAYHDPLVAGAPGHGEGHNSGLPLQITAALAVKQVMERDRLSGTLKIWPGVAEELLGGKAYFVRAGVFKDVDVCLFAHVGDTMSVSWGTNVGPSGTGMISVEYTFSGESAHAGLNPWRGKSALDAVELMDVGWNFRREHLRLQQRSHYVITNGGDQPNVVPAIASVWYYFRELDFAHITELRGVGDAIARGAALMTGTEVKSRVLGSAWPNNYSKPVAEAVYENMKTVGMPAWDPNDITLAKALQAEIGQSAIGLRSEVSPLEGPDPNQASGASDDIGDVSWNVPTITLRYPSNIPLLPGHNWANAVAMATPIAHKGVTAGAKVMAATMVDLLLRPQLVQQAWDYFRTVQTAKEKYQPLIGPDDQPVVTLNAKVMDQYRPEMRKYYYDPAKYPTYLEQLGIKYPTIRAR